MKRIYIAVLFVVLSGLFVVREGDFFCGPGQFLVLGHDGQPDRCEPCPENHYQDKNAHRETTCRSCSPFYHDQWQLILEHKCTPTSFEIITCVPDHYLKDGRCHERKCGCGEHLIIGKNGHSDSCEACGDGFFQDQENHREITCRQCTSFDEINAQHMTITARCARCHDIKIKCSDNFFFHGGQCNPCTVCSRHGLKQCRSCQDFQDTICSEASGKCEDPVPKKDENDKSGKERTDTTANPETKTPAPDKSAPIVNNETSPSFNKGLAVVAVYVVAHVLILWKLNLRPIVHR